MTDNKALSSAIKTIYSRLNDEISRTIYANRILFNYTEDPRFLRAIINESACISEFIEEINKYSDRKKIIFGAGLYGKRLKTYFPEYDWAAFADNNLAGSTIDDIPVLSVAQLVREHGDSCIVISPRTNTGEMKDQLLASNIPQDNIIVLNDYIQNIGKDIYFDLPEISHDANEIFVDGGALDGSTSCDFIKWSGHRYSDIYLFEPNSDMISKINSNLNGQDGIHIVQKGLWRRKCDLYYSKNPDNPGEGIISEERISPESETVPVTSIDEELSNVPITFIKMDIEGSEEAALRGARQVITTRKPKLAISIYHKKEDIFTLPELILSYNPDYRFYVRHYTMGPCDTVLYAI